MKERGVTLLYLLLFASMAWDALGAKTWRDLDLQNGCTISRPDLSGGRTFPGTFCVFLPDGTFISAGNKNLRRIAADGTPLWEKPALIHHQLNLSEDGKRLLALSSEVRGEGEEKLRYDVFVIYDLDGKVIAQKSAQELFSKTGIQNRVVKLLLPMQAHFGASHEGSHFNSISEIPSKVKSNHSALKPGNIVLNGLGSGIFILSPDLKKVLYHQRLPESRDHKVHDVQVTEDGDFLFFNNHVYDTGTEIPYSRIQTWNPSKKKTGLSIGPQPAAYFYSPSSGTVQKLPDGTILFTHVFTGGFYVKPNGEILGSFFGGTGDPPVLRAFMHVRAGDLSEFLKKHRRQ